jgi:hypothetical protein
MVFNKILVKKIVMLLMIALGFISIISCATLQYSSSNATWVSDQGKIWNSDFSLY